MTVPQFDEKNNNNAADRSPLQGRLPTFQVPKTVILCYHAPFFKKTLEDRAHQQCDGCFPRLYFLKDHPGVAIGNFGSGAPITTGKMEELISWGVLQFISIGTASSLQAKAKTGDIIVCEKAIRDEKTSQRFLPPAKYIHAPRRMTNKLQQQLRKGGIPFHVGSSWTTDNFLRQKDEEMLQYQKEGVLTVETEAAALFAVAHFYQVDLGAMFTITGPQQGSLWDPHLEDEPTHKGLVALLDAALEASKDQSSVNP